MGGMQRVQGRGEAQSRVRGHLGDTGIDGEKIFRWIFRKQDVGVRTGSSCLRQGELVGTYECGNEPSGSIKCGECVDYLQTGQLLEKDFSLWIKVCHSNCTVVFVQQIFLCVVFKCNNLFNCRLEFKNVVLREVLGAEMELLTGGGENCDGLQENEICGAEGDGVRWRS